MSISRYVMAFMLSLATLYSPSSDANIVIGGTRVVYPSDQAEVTVTVTNKGDEPSLVQAWLDTGDERSTPDDEKVPFVVTPPLARVEPGKGQTIRIIYTKEALPSDRESLFWLNLLDVPPKKAGSDRNLLQFAVRTRIKMMFRPSALTDAATAHEQLQWRIAPDGHDGWALQVRNPTPYHINFAYLGIKAGQEKVAGATGGMVGPQETTAFPLSGLAKPPSGEVVADYVLITDHGALAEKTRPITG